MIRLDKNSIRISKDLALWSILGVSLAFIALRNIGPFLYFTQAFIIIIMLFWIKKNNKNLLSKYIVIQILYISWNGISILWAESLNLALNTFLSIAQIVIICCCISYYCDTEDRIKRVLKAIAISGFIMIIYLILVTPISDWTYAFVGNFSQSTDEGRIGYSIGVHPNAMGTMCAILITIFTYFFDISRKKIYIIGNILLVIILLFTKSRISLFMLLIQLIGYFILRTKKKKSLLLIIPILIAISGAIVWMIFNIPLLYTLIGFRFNGILGVFNTQGIADASSRTRFLMISIGFKIFINNPILGVGVGNYAYHAYNEYGLFKQVYSHSNYIELMSNTGIIGAILYYLIPIWSTVSLYKLLHSFEGADRKICACFFVLIFTPFFTDFGKIAYNNELVQMINLLCFSASIIYHRKANI